jgi:hypothetical protein
MTAISRKQRSRTYLSSKTETATPSLSTMVASSRKRRSWSYIGWKELAFISLFMAALLSSITMLKLAIRSDWGTDHHNLLIDPPRPSPSASLAYRQSYGFFNDISDRNWKLIRQRAQRAHKIVEQEPQLMPGSSPSTWYPNDLEVSP